MTTRSRLRGAGLVAAMAWVGLVVMSACAGEDPGTETEGPVGEVQQAIGGSGEACYPPNFLIPTYHCNTGLTCCTTFAGSHICRDLDNDVNNCGACFNVCPSGHFCHQGQCVT